MRHLLCRATLAAAAGLVLSGQILVAQSAETKPMAAIPGFDAALLDRSVQPCDDFYRFACGGWMAKNPVPPDQTRWGRSAELRERNYVTLRDLLEKAGKPDAQRNPIDQKIGDFYASCVDEAAVEAKGVAPLKPQLDRIAAMKTKADLATEVARLQAANVQAIFTFSAQPDFKKSTVTTAWVDQNGLGLPDRDYYLDDAQFGEIRKQYAGHVQKMFELLGETPAAAAKDAQTVLDIETALAKVSIDRVQRREPSNRYHPMTRAQLAGFVPNFDWNTYFKATAAPAFTDMNVAWPDFFRGFNEQLEKRSLDDWKTYLRWHAVHNAAPFLSAAFVDEDFRFFDKVLTGAQELQPRWKRCVDHVDDQLGEALGQRYVEATFGPEGRERMLKMVLALESALERDIRELPWMTETTKKRAHEKLATVKNKIGHPDDWRDYTPVDIVRGDLLGNVGRAEAFDTARRLRKIGQKVDPMEWSMTPPTVNANYNSSHNTVNFPAGILQPPFFDKNMDDAINFGAIGSVIGHELSHGFDDQGRKFDAQGNFTDWWTEEDGKEFEKRASCIADQYSQYTVADGVHLNGRLTLGENTADNGGVRIAYMALQDTLKGKKVEPRDGFTPEQRLFLGWGQIWCQNSTPESEKLRAQTDPHSAGRYRVNGVVSNMPEFQKAYNCPAGSPMVRENACRVW